jgi:hypothetical protein
MIIQPIVAGVRLAPTTAIDAGRNSESSVLDKSVRS